MCAIILNFGVMFGAWRQQKKMNDMSEWKHDIRSLVRRFEQAVNSGYMMNMDDEEIIDLFD